MIEVFTKESVEATEYLTIEKSQIKFLKKIFKNQKYYSNVFTTSTLKKFHFFTDITYQFPMDFKVSVF